MSQRFVRIKTFFTKIYCHFYLHFGFRQWIQTRVAKLRQMSWGRLYTTETGRLSTLKPADLWLACLTKTGKHLSGLQIRCIFWILEFLFLYQILFKRVVRIIPLWFWQTVKHRLLWRNNIIIPNVSFIYASYLELWYIIALHIMVKKKKFWGWWCKN